MKKLNEVVLDALDLHGSYSLPRLTFKRSKLRLVVASGNALPTGRIVFQDQRCLFADEGRYRDVLQENPEIDAAAVISASGEKHAPVIVAELLKRKLPTSLLTCVSTSSAAKLLPPGDVFVTRSVPEPITYNTSTYMGMMLAKTQERPLKIKQHLLKRVRPQLPDFRKYRAFFLMVPPEFDLLREMFITKFDELFGPRLIGRCYTLDQTYHAKTVVPWNKELFISFGIENHLFGTQRLGVRLPKDTSFVGMMATVYYVIGKVQEQFPPWFEKNAEEYARFQHQLPFH
jgi:hypothetical protein